MELLTHIEKSTLLTLLDRFPQHNNEQTAVWDLLTANLFEQRFLLAVVKTIPSILEKLNLTCGLQPNTQNFMLVGSDSQVLPNSRVQSLVRQLESVLLEKGWVDYNVWVQSIMTAGKDFLYEQRQYFRSNKILDDGIEGAASVPETAGSGMASYEVNYQAAGTRMVLFPNANDFHQEHIDIWSETAPVAGRYLRDYFFSCTYAPLHEMIHCIQATTMGPTTDKNIWSKEHGACFVQMNFLAVVSKQRPDLFPAGLLEQIVLWYYELVSRLHPLSIEYHEAYEQWRDSFSAQPPSATDSATLLSEKRIECFYMKARLAVEAYDEGATFLQFMDAHFSEANIIYPPENLHLPPKVLEITNLPVMNVHWAEFIPLVK